MLRPLTEIDLGDQRLGLRRAGSSGPVLLCLHGFPQTSACWEPLASRLEDRFQLLMPDLPGFGASDPCASADGRTVSDAMVALLDALGIDRVTVVGHDFGGAVAWAMGLARADRLDGLIVINSPFRKLDLRRGWHMLAFNLPILPEITFTLGGGPLVEALIKRLIVDKDAIPADAMREYRGAFRTIEAQRNAFAYYRTVTRAFLRSSVRRMVPSFVPFIGARPSSGAREERKIEVPTMVIWGAADPVLPVHLTDDLSRHVSDLRLEIIENVGHFVPEEAPDDVARLIDGFAG